MWRCTSVAAVQRTKNTDLQDKTEGWIEAAAAAGGGGRDNGSEKVFCPPRVPVPTACTCLRIKHISIFIFMFFFAVSLRPAICLSAGVFFFPLPSFLPAPLPALLLPLAGGWEKKK